MMKYKIHTKLISFIANIYVGEQKCSWIKVLSDVNITNGIRQGCNRSTILFLMVTYMIMKLQMPNNKLKCNICHLFFPDDGLLLAKNVNEAMEECGLEINKRKSNVMIYNENANGEIYEIEGITITNEIRYLGFQRTNKRNCFLTQKQKVLLDAKEVWEHKRCASRTITKTK